MIKKFAAFLTFVIVLAGCASAPQQAVSIDKSAVYRGDAKIGVMLDTLPTPSVSLPGAGCLLCLATAASANSALSKHVKTLSVDELSDIKTEAAELLQSNGSTVVSLDTETVLEGMPKLRSK